MNFEELYVDTCTSASLAAAKGDAKGLKKLIKKKSPTNGQDNKGWRALHYACYGGHIECIEILLKASDVDINAITFERQTALYLTCCSKLEPESMVTVAKILLEAGADPNHENQKQYITILNQAISLFNLPLIELLLKHGVNVNEHDDKFGSTLNAAVETENLHIVELIISRRLQYTTNPYGRGVIAFFHTAVLQRNSDLLSLLVRKPHCLTEINHQDVRGRTCLYLACSVGFREGVRILLDSGADPNIRCLENDLPVMAFTEHIQEEDLINSESLFGQLIRLTNKIELKKPSTCDTSFFHMLSHCDKQDLIFDYILDFFPDLYSSTIVAKMDNTIRLPSVSFQALPGNHNLSPLAYWCGLVSPEKKYHFFRKMVEIDYHIRDTTRHRLPPIIMATGTKQVDPYVISYLIRNGADVMATVGDPPHHGLPTGFQMSLLAPTCDAVQSLLVNSVPLDIILRKNDRHEITSQILSAAHWVETYDHDGSHVCINLLRNLICLSKFIPLWPFDLDLIERRVTPPEEVRDQFEELMDRCMDIEDNPKCLWNLASLKLRTVLWEKGGGVAGVPMCICVEEFCKKMKLPPRIEKLLSSLD